MADIGKVTPGSPVIPRVPRDQPATDEREHRQGPPEEQQEREGEEPDENNKQDKAREGGIDLFV